MHIKLIGNRIIGTFLVVAFVATNARGNDDDHPPAKRLVETIVSLVQQQPALVLISFGAFAFAAYLMRGNETPPPPAGTEPQTPEDEIRALREQVRLLEESCAAEKRAKEECERRNEQLKEEIKEFRALVKELHNSQAESEQESFCRIRMKQAEIDQANRMLSNQQQGCNKQQEQCSELRIKNAELTRQIERLRAEMTRLNPTPAQDGETRATFGTNC